MQEDPEVQNFHKALYIALSLANLSIEVNFNVLEPLAKEPVPKLEASVADVLCQLQNPSLAKFYMPILNSITRFGLLNVWDIGLNRTVRPFLESFSGCFKSNSPFFFIGVKEAKSLHAPPGAESHSEGYFNWRSKLQYLLRPYQLSIGSTKIICTVYVTYDNSVDSKDEVEKARKKVDELCKFTFQQMQIEEKIECTVHSINHNGDCCLLIDKLKSVAKHGKTVEISIFDLFLRCILEKHIEDSCIKREELKKFANSLNQKIDNECIENFCQEFTSFGSILDVKQINPSSDLVIIKPAIFLKQLGEFLKQPDLQKSNLFEVCEKKRMIQVLVDVGLAAAVYRKIDLTAEPCYHSLKQVWLSSALKFHNHKQNFTKGAIQFVLGLGAPRLNLNTRVFGLMMKKYSTGFKLGKESNTVVFQIPCEVRQADSNDDYIDVTLSFMGNVIEITLANFENIPSDLKQARIKSICSELILIFKKSIQSCWERFKEIASIKCHFAVLCLKDEIGDQMLFSAYRIRHILPASELCTKCWNDDDFKKHLPVIDIWKRVLEDKEHVIPSHLKLNGDFSMENIAMLAKRLATFPWEAIKILAIELESAILQIEPACENRRELTILAMLVQWENENHRNQPDSLRKIMALKLHDAEDRCQGIIENIPDFSKLARELDMQVLTRKQRKEVVDSIKRDVHLDHQELNEVAPVPTAKKDIKPF